MIRKLLRKHFHLRFKAMPAAMVRYHDPLYNEKRVWVARLLAQLYNEGAIIISLDESNFRQDILGNRRWRFQP